jgi:DNA (cytosine-5)-methyltransferase 1
MPVGMPGAKGLTIGSLFSGIGGLELGLERAGLGPVVWQVEREPYCQAVLAKHWPDAARYDDVCTVGAHNLTPVDVICGGFPCQDISQAGKRVGIGGERSGLWSEYARILRELRPRYAVVENVSDLLVRGFDVVLGDLAEIGYDAEWDCLPASAVGAPHRRDRVFLLAYPVGAPGRPETRIADGGDWSAALRVGTAESRGRRRDVANAPGKRLEGWPTIRHEVDAPRGRLLPARHGESRGAEQWATEPDVGRLVDGVPARLVRPTLAALGNAVVPQVAEVVGRLIVARERALVGVAA